MTDKILEQFEDYWARQLWAEVYDDVKDQMFIIWKASREAVVVDLPATGTLLVPGWNQAVHRCREAIEAQSLRVRP